MSPDAATSAGFMAGCYVLLIAAVVATIASVLTGLRQAKQKADKRQPICPWCGATLIDDRHPPGTGALCPDPSLNDLDPPDRIESPRVVPPRPHRPRHDYRDECKR